MSRPTCDYQKTVRPSGVEFSTLQVGKCFCHERGEAVYMKMSPYWGASIGAGTIVEFKGSQNVIPVNVTKVVYQEV